MDTIDSRGWSESLSSLPSSSSASQIAILSRVLDQSYRQSPYHSTQSTNSSSIKSDQSSNDSRSLDSSTNTMMMKPTDGTAAPSSTSDLSSSQPDSAHSIPCFMSCVPFELAFPERAVEMKKRRRRKLTKMEEESHFISKDNRIDVDSDSNHKRRKLSTVKSEEDWLNGDDTRLLFTSHESGNVSQRDDNAAADLMTDLFKSEDIQKERRMETEREVREAAMRELGDSSTTVLGRIPSAQGQGTSLRKSNTMGDESNDDDNDFDDLLSADNPRGKGSLSEDEEELVIARMSDDDDGPDSDIL